MAIRRKPPELPPDVKEALGKMAEGVAKEMSPKGERQRLSLDQEEIDAIQRMRAQEFELFLLRKGIVDFSKPVLLVTPDGTAEKWMQSAEQIRAFLWRHEVN